MCTSTYTCRIRMYVCKRNDGYANKAGRMQMNRHVLVMITNTKEIQRNC